MEQKKLLEDFFDQSKIDYNFTKMDGKFFLYACDKYNDYVGSNMRLSLKEMSAIYSDLNTKKVYNIISLFYKIDPGCDIKVTGKRSNGTHVKIYLYEIIFESNDVALLYAAERLKNEVPYNLYKYGKQYTIREKKEFYSEKYGRSCICS